MKTRIKKIVEILDENQAAIITSDVNRRYLTGFPSSAGTVIITAENSYFLIDFRYFEKAKSVVENMNVILCEKPFLQISEVLKNAGITSVLIESDRMTIAEFESFKKNLTAEVSSSDYLGKTLKKLRSIKSAEEIEFIKKAQSITDKGFAHILNYISDKVSEIDLMLELEFFMRKNGSEGIAFDTIAVSGKNSSLPHGVPTSKSIEIGDFLTLDFGAAYKGYCSDMTRTVAFGGISNEQKKVYDTVLKAQLEAISAVAPKKVCKDIDKIARDIIYGAGYEGCFGHGLGHSVGLEIHESPCFNTRDDTVLEPGMILTVEPGIYIENEFGVRIEDMVLVTENSYEILTKSPKELIIL